ncbi:sodium:solute symporter [Oceanihabitans sediminis]|uniref:Sodium:solute symporter family protein n=1 Tax=Oceanihabitans sediminis TaxID=1812012 RepID=A0A368P6Z0_9FLAO|nr:sodium:solute symporter family protein [Oceanihabitans sediminis]MDX1278656.1 sodium:solute symporter family protein [Oceanihabitans sediminis]RBP34562.1 SSS family solute:Na+ symporter [Oceanihabitans sediminis]RCU58226.1 sodium:solute symporter family protein [Oceanihabitans sediminis]
MHRTTLTISLLAIYVIAIIAIGLWNSKNDNSEDYFLASRKLPAWLLAITFIASWWGGGSAIDLVDHAHKNGLSSFWIYGVPVLIATALMYMFSKGIRNIGTISQPELMRERYNNTVALLLTVFIIIFMVIASAVQVIVIGRFFHAYFDIGYANAAILGTLIVLAYSMFGGFKGVVLTDLLQFVFFLFTGIFLFYLSYSQSGGMEFVKINAIENGKEGYSSFFSNVADNLAYVITFGTSWMIQANIWQRISAAKKGSDAKKMMLISFLAFIPLYFMVTYTGMFSSVLYETVPETGIIPDMVSKLSSPILSAILFVGLCSAIMSTMDSLINTGAMSLTVDVFQKYIKPNAKPKVGVFVARVSTVVMAAIALFIALRIQSVLTISWIASDFLTSGAFVPLVMGFLWARGTSKAATVSMLFGLLFASYNLNVALGADLPVAWEIASAKQAIIGIAISFILYVSVSFLTPIDTEKSRKFIRKANVFGKY